MNGWKRGETHEITNEKNRHKAVDRSSVFSCSRINIANRRICSNLCGSGNGPDALGGFDLHHVDGRGSRVSNHCRLWFGGRLRYDLVFEPPCEHQAAPVRLGPDAQLLKRFEHYVYDHPDHWYLWQEVADLDRFDAA